jgi:hypothetical protein
MTRNTIEIARPFLTKPVHLSGRNVFIRRKDFPDDQLPTFAPGILLIFALVEFSTTIATLGTRQTHRFLATIPPREATFDDTQWPSLLSDRDGAQQGSTGHRPFRGFDDAVGEELELLSRH